MATDSKNTKTFYNTEIPKGWEIRKLGDVGKIRMCKRVFNHETSEEGDIPFFKIGTFGKEPDAFISKDLYENYRKRFSFPKVGDILISAAGTLGRTVVYDGSPAYFQDSNIVWINNEESLVTNAYLFFVYQTIKYESEGGTIQRLYNNIISDAKFLRPPLPEQKAIAKVLSTADAAIHTTEKLITQKELRKKWLMQQLLSEKRIVKNEKWCKSGIRRVELFEIGKIVSGGTPDTTVNEYWDGNINWVTPTDITALKGAKYLYGTKRKITEKGLKNSSAEIIPINSIVITTRATIGEMAINKEPMTTNQGFKSVIPNPEKVNTEYLYYLLQTKKHQLIALGSGSTFFEVSKSDIFHFPFFIVHSIEEQTAIAQVLQAADKEISLLKAKAEKLREQKKGLMQVLLTGKVRLKIDKANSAQ